MTFPCSQIMLSVSDLKSAYQFYVEKLQFEIVEEHPKMFAFRAGDVRFSVFLGGQKLDIEKDPANISLMFKTENLEKTVAELKARDVQFTEEIQTAPGFMKHISLNDPDNNSVFFAEYFRDPLLKT